jgi:hypothetical protein
MGANESAFVRAIRALARRWEMSILSVGAGNLPRYRLRGRVSTVRASSDEMELRAGEPRRLDGDYRCTTMC